MSYIIIKRENQSGRKSTGVRLVAEVTDRKELNEFIKSNYQLSATIGVFGALAAFFVRLVGFEQIALIPLMIFFILMIELIDDFPEIAIPLKSSVKLLAFEFLMVGLLIAIGWYILTEYVTVYYGVFVLVFFLSIYAGISIKIIQKVRPWLKEGSRTDDTYKFFNRILLIGMFVTVWLLAFVSMDLVTTLTKSLL